MSVPMILGLALFITVVIIVGIVLMYLNKTFAPAELQMPLQAGIVVILVLIILIRLYLVTTV